MSNVFEILEDTANSISETYRELSQIQYQTSYLSIQKGLLFQLIQTLQAQRTQLQSTSGCKQSFNEVN